MIYKWQTLILIHKFINQINDHILSKETLILRIFIKNYKRQIIGLNRIVKNFQLWVVSFSWWNLLECLLKVWNIFLENFWIRHYFYQIDSSKNLSNMYLGSYYNNDAPEL